MNNSDNHRTHLQNPEQGVQNYNENRKIGNEFQLQNNRVVSIDTGRIASTFEGDQEVIEFDTMAE